MENLENKSNPRFGDQFPAEFDKGNRLKVFNKEGLPEWVEVGREIRESLKQSVEEEGWPECPEEIDNIEGLFSQAQNSIAERWSKSTSENLNQILKGFAEKVPETEEWSNIKNLLTQPESIENQLRLQQFGVLEDLRKTAPEAWRALIMISSERQLATLTLMRRWAKELSPEQEEAIGLQKSEIKLYLDLAAILGKYVDQAYLKQIELADLPGGSETTKLAGEKGAEYVYDIYRSPESKDIDLKPYIEVFPYELPQIAKRFETLAGETERLLKQKELPDEYQALPQYLRKLAEVYGSREVDPAKLDSLWTNLTKDLATTVKSGCPIMILPQREGNVARDANKVDIEVRFGLRTPETKKIETAFDDYQAIAQELLDQNKDQLAEPYKIPKVVPNFQPFAFGPNDFWLTRGQEGRDIILTHTNPVIEVALAKEIPYLEKILGEKIDSKSYAQGAITETALHETSHAIFSIEDDNIHKRLGVGTEINTEAQMLDELKAETVAMKLISERIKRSPQPINETEIANHFYAKLGTVCDYLVNKSPNELSGMQYYYSGIAEIAELLKQGVLQEKDGKYEVTDPQKGIEVLGNIGTEILEKIYTNPETKPENVKNYINQIIKEESSEAMQKFLQTLKG